MSNPNEIMKDDMITYLRGVVRDERANATKQRIRASEAESKLRHISGLHQTQAKTIRVMLDQEEKLNKQLDASRVLKEMYRVQYTRALHDLENLEKSLAWLRS